MPQGLRREYGKWLPQADALILAARESGVMGQQGPERRKEQS